MKELQIFKSEEFGELRMIEIESKPYFVANDVAKALGYKRPADAITTHCKGSVKHRYLTGGGEQEVKVIPEGDVYRLIVKSQLPEAERFEKWVFDEVIPTIRKTGGYVNNEDTFVNTYLPFADDGVKALFSQTLGALRKANEKIEQHTYNAHNQGKRKRTAVFYKQIFS